MKNCVQLALPKYLGLLYVCEYILYLKSSNVLNVLLLGCIVVCWCVKWIKSTKSLKQNLTLATHYRMMKILVLISKELIAEWPRSNNFSLSPLGVVIHHSSRWCELYASFQFCLRREGGMIPLLDFQSWRGECTSV